MDFDEILRFVGKYGSHQQRYTVLLSLVMMFSLQNLYTQVLSAGKSNHWCQSWPDEDCDDLDLGLTREECNGIKRAMSVPSKMDENNTTLIYEQCVKYNYSGITFASAIDFPVDNILEIIPCNEGWDFDKMSFPSTIIIDFELVCEKSILPNIAQSFFFAGFLVGSLLAGLIADIYGRRMSLLIWTIALSVCGIAIAVSPNVWTFIATRFMMGIITRGTSLCCFVIVTEQVSKSMRIIAANVIFIASALGLIILAGLAKIVPNWRHVQLATSIPNIVLFIVAFFFATESPRWLISKGRYTEAERVLRKMAATNKKTIPKDFPELLKELNKDHHSSQGNICDLFNSRISLLIMVTMCIIWYVHSIVYFGLTLSAAEFGIDPYISIAVSGASEAPAFILCIYAAEKFGRRATSFVSMIIAGITCCLTPLVPLGIFCAILSTTGKFFGTIAFSISYTWSAELLPTAMRSSGLGLMSMSSRIGGVMIPLILLLSDVWISLPILIMGTLSIIGGGMCLLLPETKQKPLPTTIEDVEMLYKKSATRYTGERDERNGQSDGQYHYRR